MDVESSMRWIWRVLPPASSTTMRVASRAISSSGCRTVVNWGVTHDRFTAKRTGPPPDAALKLGTPAWDRLVVEFHGGSGARVWAEVQGSSKYPDALDEALALWRAVFEEWLAHRGQVLAPASMDELRHALGLGKD